MALKLKVRTIFPALVSATSPVTVSKTGLAYTFGFDVTALRTALDPYYAVTNLNSLILNGATSGTATVQASAIAGASVLTLPVATDTLVGKATTDTLTNKTLTAPVIATISNTGVLTLPTSTDTLIGKATTDILTNKTFDTAGTGNVLKINGTTVSAKTGSGSVVLATSPALTTPDIGAATGTSLAATGLIKSSGTAGIGYATGAGGAVTQATSRTTGVQLDKTSGAITLFAAAPAVGTWVSCTVTNSTVAATDTISLSVQSSNAANTYIANVTTVAAGSFRISFTTIVGTTSDSPVLNFNVIKGVAA